MKKLTPFIVVLVFALSLQGVRHGFAEPAPADTANRPEKKERLKDKIETVRLLRLVEALNLDKEKAAKVNDILKKYETQRLNLVKKRQAQLKNLREEVKAEKPNIPAVKSLTQEVLKLNNEFMEIQNNEFKEISQHLDDLQQGKFVLFRHEFNKQVQEIVQRRKVADQKKDPVTTSKSSKPAK